MGVRFVIGEADGDAPAVVMYDSSSGFAFGPLFTDEDEAQGFVDWVGSATGQDARERLEISECGGDLRKYGDGAIRSMYREWLSTRTAASKP